MKADQVGGRPDKFLLLRRCQFESGTCQVKDLASKSQQDIPLTSDGAELVATIRSLLAN